jgi:hypothetical protein
LPYILIAHPGQLVVEENKNLHVLQETREFFVGIMDFPKTLKFCAEGYELAVRKFETSQKLLGATNGKP